MRKGHIDDDVIEIEFASAAFLEKALKKEIAPGVIPARVVPVISPSTATATVKVLGVPPEASIQSLREALVHHGTIQSAWLLPTVSGTGFIGFVTFLSSASGKAALEASYGFLGKEHIHIVHPAVTREAEDASPRWKLRLTNLPPNTTDWELLGIMTTVKAINWHVPRVPWLGMSHLRCRYALVEFDSSTVCQQVSSASYWLCGHKLLWHHPSVVTCYKCGAHGHLQASCPVKPQVPQVRCTGARQSGVSYANAVQSNTGITVQSQAQPQLGTTKIQPVVLAENYANQITTASRLDALESQVNTLSTSFQILLTRLDGMTSAITSVGQAVDAIAARMPVTPQAVPLSNLTGTDSHGMVVESPILTYASHQSHTSADSSVIPSSQGDTTVVAHAPSLHSDGVTPQGGHHLLSENTRIMHLENHITQLSAMLKVLTTQPLVMPYHLPGQPNHLTPSGATYPSQSIVPLWQ